MDKPFVAESGNDRVAAAQSAIENAIADTAQLLFGMAQTRLDLRISVAIGEDSSGKAAQTALAETRRALVEARWRSDSVLNQSDGPGS